MKEIHASATAGTDFLDFVDVLETVEGCLLDNYIGEYYDRETGKISTVALFEEYETEYTSGYQILKAETPEDIEKLYVLFEERKAEYQKAVNG